MNKIEHEPLCDNTLDMICKILEKSIEKNGDKPITSSHLLNIIRLADKMLIQEEDSNCLEDCHDIGG